MLLHLSDCGWSLTLCDFELLLQRHQLQPEELSHLLVLLSLPEFKIQSCSQPFEHSAPDL